MKALKLFCLFPTLVVLGLLLAGCSTPTADGRSGTIEVSLLPGGRAIVAGKEVAAEELAARLKRIGAKSDTRIAISISTRAPMRLVQSTTEQLSRAGFHRVVFLRPRQAGAYSSK